MKIRRIFKTILSIIIWIILIYLSKLYQFNTNTEISRNFRNSEEITGIGGIFGIIISLIVVLYVIPSIWKKTKTEKIISKGMNEELDELFEAYKLDIFSKAEYESKKDELLEKSLIKEKNKQREEEQDYNKDRKEKTKISLIKLEELKNKKLISESEYAKKKNKLTPKKLTLEELENLVEYCGFQNMDTESFLKANIIPKTENLGYEDLYYIINNKNQFGAERIFQVYYELKKRIKNTNTNIV